MKKFFSLAALAYVCAGFWYLFQEFVRRYRWVVRVGEADAERDNYEVQLRPRFGNKNKHFPGFKLRIKSKTDRVEVDWDKTQYICDGTTLGGFVFSDISFEQQLAQPIHASVVMGEAEYNLIPRCAFREKIERIPDDRVSLPRRRKRYGIPEYDYDPPEVVVRSTPVKKWSADYLGVGQHGVLLSLLVNGEETEERLVLRIDREEIEKNQSTSPVYLGQ